uniref:EF-hand domain-containing protein n=1 Tax=Favella ehrenbergii TaxID=182087 RepID=A0A7S3I0U6_9SPIT
MVEADTQRERMMALLAPLIEDKNAWEASFTEEERAKGEQFEQELKTSPEALQAFMAQIDAAFTGADADQDGLLQRAEFKSFVETMNGCGVERGLKHRDTTDEFIDKVFPCFNGFSAEVDGVSKNEILMILNMVNANQ